MEVNLTEKNFFQILVNYKCGQTIKKHVKT